MVDENKWGIDINEQRQPIPFLENDGKYWGLPKDGKTAIREFERLRKTGASFIVFAWPSFWWLDYYKDFILYIENKFNRIFKNEYIIIFNLKIPTT